MSDPLTISAVARATGIPAKTIRFYESEGIVPRPTRTTSGYRQYTPADIRRLALIKSVRKLGLSVSEAGTFVDRAFSSECAALAPELLQLVASRRTDARTQIRELRRLIHELDALESHVAHADCVDPPGERVAECDVCVDQAPSSRGVRGSA